VSGLVIDLFAGGGGASTGIEAALGRNVDIAINHDRTAIAVHEANHPDTAHITGDIWEARPREVTRGRPVALLWASPDCTDFSVAKGGKPRRQNIRSLAWVVVTWAKQVRPHVIMLENVQEFRGWGPLGRDGVRIKERAGETFAKWKRALERLGYVVEHRVLDASHYGAPTRRRRLFLIARCDGQAIVWPEASHGPGLAPYRTAAECIDWSLPCPSIFERKRPLAEKTLWRIAQGLRRFVFENPKPFILKVNHGKWEPRHEDLDEPLSTVTATQRGHAVVAPTLVQTGYGEREGQRPRALHLDLPLGTVVGGGQKHALCEAFLLKHFGDPLRKSGGGIVVGSELTEPIGTVTGRDHHSLAAVALAKFRGTHPNQPASASVDEPLSTISWAASTLPRFVPS
jgi:DNA (cytosine-5)-methyltransferase 1